MTWLCKKVVKISVMPNGLQKYMAFTINKNVFLLKACNS